MEENSQHNPLILAPAGGRDAFLAALAAGADAVYCGLKQFSARMQAHNFSMGQLAALTRLAHLQGVKVYVAFNSIIKPDELAAAATCLKQLQDVVEADAVIFQDLALAQLARQTGFQGELHLSTLANFSFAGDFQGLNDQLGVSRFVLPRELTVDEMKAVAGACPPEAGLEVFIHGALCYAVSGRCYWSSYMGGKSGLRGRCVQPCRRRYVHGKQKQRFFSCMDLSIDVLVKVLLSIPQIKVWKIEGRKKGPHYVYNTVSAYRLLRDQGRDPQVKKEALALLNQSLGRRGSHYRFLTQRPYNPTASDGDTASGLKLGSIKGAHGSPYFLTREALYPGDVLRIGYEDDTYHGIQRVNKYVPRKGRFSLKFPQRRRAANGTGVFLIDRRPADMLEAMGRLEAELQALGQPPADRPPITCRLPRPASRTAKMMEMNVYRQARIRGARTPIGMWLSAEALKGLPRQMQAKVCWWLPPVVWPSQEARFRDLVRSLVKGGGRQFVLNQPWQRHLFRSSRGLKLWAGPFCNIANPLAVETAKKMGFAGVIVSPELGQEDYLQLARRSPLPLGMVLSGLWPVCVSRILPDQLKIDRPFSSPKGEQAWTHKSQHLTWVFPNWQLDLTQHRQRLHKAGYQLFVHLHEAVPKTIRLKKRPGLWNWRIGLP